MCALCSDVTILVFSSRFDFDSIFYKDSMSIRFRFQFFRREISYTSPINLGAAMLNYSVKAGEAGDDSERSGSYMTPWSGHGDRTARPLPHAIRIIKSAYSAPFATAQLSCFELAAVRCLRQYSRESKSKKSQKIDFDSIQFKRKNSISIFDSIIVTSLALWNGKTVCRNQHAVGCNISNEWTHRRCSRSVNVSVIN